MLRLYIGYNLINPEFSCECDWGILLQKLHVLLQKLHTLLQKLHSVLQKLHILLQKLHSINVQNSFFTYEEIKIINLPEKLWNVSTLINKEAVKNKIN